MSSPPPDRCGYTWPGDHERDAESYQQSCCWRETADDADRCVWHADPETIPKSLQDLQEARAPPELRDQNASYVELLDGATLTDVELGDEISLKNVALRDSDLSGTNLRRANLSGASLFGANLPGANLQGTDLTNADLQDTDLTDADLSYATLNETTLAGANFTDADLSYAILTGAFLVGADLTNADLSVADLTDANLRDVDLTDAVARNSNFDAAILENAILTRTDLRESSLDDADLYQTQFADTRINSQTDFGADCRYESENHPPRSMEIHDDTSDGVAALEGATWVYRRLEGLHEENALADETRAYHIRKEEARRELDRRQGNYGRYAVATLNRLLTNHGESIKRLFVGWLMTIVGAGVLYPFVGGVKDGDTVYQITIVSAVPTPADLVSASEALGRGLYFSAITFTTIGYANVAPHGSGSRLLVGIESLIGAILIALFVYVLGRRTAR